MEYTNAKYANYHPVNECLMEKNDYYPIVYKQGGMHMRVGNQVLGKCSIKQQEKFTSFPLIVVF